MSRGCQTFYLRKCQLVYILTLKELMCYHGKKRTVMLLNTVVMDQRERTKF